MFFMFSFDLLYWLVLGFIYLILLLLFPVPVLLITMLGIWWLVKGSKNKVEDFEDKEEE